MKKQGNQRGLNNSGRVALTIISCLFLAVFIVTAAMYTSVAVTGRRQGHNLHELALNQYLSGGVEQARRGNILDRNGITLASQLTSYTLSANLHAPHGEIVENIEETARQLSTVLNLTEERIAELLSEPDRHNVSFGSAGRNLSFTEREAIEEMELKGLIFTEQVRRFYPNGVFASHTIGFTRLEEDTHGETLEGQMGIELQFDDLLRGTNGRYQFLRDRMGFLQRNREVFTIQEAINGHDIQLTLDRTIQTFLENAMQNVWEEANPESIVAIVADPNTGEILAMGNRSSFDPNVRDIENFHNTAISEPFEPGSTLKVFTYAAAINEGNFQGNLPFQSGARVLSNGVRITDWDQSWGVITHNEGFYRSSNTGVVDMLTEWISPEKNLEYLQKFGFGSPVGIQLPGEQGGFLPINGEFTQQITSGYGQGLTTTPIQHIQAMTAILNDGQLIKPQLISQIYDPNEEEVVFEFEVEHLGNPITAETAAQVRELMVGVVENPVGSGHILYRLDNFTSGGKTGTAQIPDLVHGGYLSNDYLLFSYVGFAPADDPQLVMYLAMSKPQSRPRYGHTYLSEIYRFVMTQSLNYLGVEWVPFTSMESINTIEVPNVLNKQNDVASELLESLDFNVIVIGDRPQVYLQLPTANSMSAAGRKVFIQTDNIDNLPDFTGWSRTEVNQYRTLLDLDIEFIGEGFVVDQSLEPGTEVGAGDTIQITLEREASIPE